MTLPLDGLRIGLLTASASRLGGGVAEAVMIQAAMIRELGGEAVVFALEDEFAEEDRARYAPSELHLLPMRGPAQIGYAPGLVDGLLAAKLDLLHLHGIWMYPSRAGARWAKATGKPYIISPHGMLDPWITGRGRWKKTLARIGYERIGWRSAAFLHALTAREAADIARESSRTDSVVIANAAPPVLANRDQPRAAHFAYIGRIHPKKNLLALVTAWSELARPDDAELTLAGWGDPADVAVLEAAVAQHGPSLCFVGPIYGAAKEELLTQAQFMVLPSLSEGLPMAILEGWAAGTPAIMTEGCNLPEGFAGTAAMECGTSAAAIRATLAQALALSSADWRAMSANARGLAAGPFSAATIAARWGEAYSRAIGLGSQTVK